jgi:hypothetical protein
MPAADLIEKHQTFFSTRKSEKLKNWCYKKPNWYANILCAVFMLLQLTALRVNIGMRIHYLVKNVLKTHTNQTSTKVAARNVQMGNLLMTLGR